MLTRRHTSLVSSLITIGIVLVCLCERNNRMTMGEHFHFQNNICPEHTPLIGKCMNNIEKLTVNGTQRPQNDRRIPLYPSVWNNYKYFQHFVCIDYDDLPPKYEDVMANAIVINPNTLPQSRPAQTTHLPQQTTHLP